MQYTRRAVRLLAALALCLAAHTAAAQNADPKPSFRDFKGVTIGMTAAESRAKLGAPTDAGDAQDFYAVSDKQTVTVYYGADKKVSALSVIYNNAAEAPAPKLVFGSDVDAKPDGSCYKMERYPKAGFWLSYSRTAGSEPMVVIAMQKIN